MKGLVPDLCVYVPDMRSNIEKRRRQLLLALVYYYQTTLPVPNPKIENAVAVYLSKADKHFREEFRISRDIFDGILSALRPSLETRGFEHLAVVLFFSSFHSTF